MDYKYSIIIESNFHIENFLSNNNRTNDSFFYTEGSDEDGDKTFYFTSKLLNNSEEPQEIYDIANQILSLYRGIFRLIDRNRIMKNYFIIDRLIDNQLNRVVSQVLKSDIYKINIDFTQIEKSTQNEPKHPIYILFERVIEYPFLVNLFFLISQQVDYRMLYIIYDDIRYFLREIDDKTFLDEFKNELNSFSHTANNYEVLGFYARHGRMKYDPPKNPINLKDSMNLIFNIVNKLLNEKFNIIVPTYCGLVYSKDNYSVN